MGSLAFSSSSGDLYGNETLTTFRLGPRGYYLLIDQIAVGGELNLTHSKYGEASTTSIAIGPDALYFFDMGSEEMHPFGGIGVFYNSYTSKYSGHGETKSGGILSLHGGVAYLLKPNLAIWPELSLEFESRDSKSGTTIMLGVGLAGMLY